jgi:hypothetical protein
MFLLAKMQQYMDKSGDGHFQCLLPCLLINLDAATPLVHSAHQSGCHHSSGAHAQATKGWGAVVFNFG